MVVRTAESKGQQMKVPDNGDYTRFQHASEYHARLPCLLCHRRENNSAQPSMPGATDHLPCAGCHKNQFADSGNAICTICHLNPQAGTLKAFPRIRSFNVKFSHAGHMGQGRFSCEGCHRPARRGVAMTIPTGFNAHTACFQCHSPQAKSGDRDISSCGVCHEAGRLTRTSQMARAFRIGFSHQRHNRDERLNCSDCHRAVAGRQRNEMTAPQALNHHATPGRFSCGSCHNGQRAFGGDDFSVCTRCHRGAGWRF